jgi:glycosyltransferase involved in cell wall biosynthesis
MPSIIIPANNEEAHLGACLDALVRQDYEGAAEVIVSANACTDGTVALAESRRARFEERGWDLVVLDRAEPGKRAALNAADAVAHHGARIYVDADMICSLSLVTDLMNALDTPEPRYVAGTLRVAPPRSWVTRHYARLWTKLPFMTAEGTGAGLYAVNAAGREKWTTFPDLIADDGYVRLLFAPHERERVQTTYETPLAEGFQTLVRVRRRQDAGNAELARKFPELMRNESKPSLRIVDHLRLLAGQPISYLVYVGVILAVRYAKGRRESGWVRGR